MWCEENISGAAAEEISSSSELGHNSIFPHFFNLFSINQTAIRSYRGKTKVKQSLCRPGQALGIPG